MGKRRRRREANQQAFLASQAAAMAESQEARAQFEAQLQQQNQSYLERLTQTQEQVAAATTANVVGPPVMKLGATAAEAQSQYSRNSKRRRGLSSTIKAGDTGARTLIG